MSKLVNRKYIGLLGFIFGHKLGRSDAHRGRKSGLTDSRNDPDLHIVEDSGMQKKYLVLSEEERKKVFVRPVRQTYVHEKCGVATTMGLALSETYARDPKFYSGTYCVGCKAHFPVGEKGEFHWDDGQKVGE